MWIQTAWGSVCRSGLLNGGRGYYGEVRLGRRFVGWHSLRAEQRWLLEKRTTIADGSHFAPLTASQTTPGAGPCKVLKRRVDLPLT